jgi:uncharacterized glyoxalase superfamily protein PhnB
MISNRSLPTDTVLPHLLYGDLDEAIPWLTRAFGFVEHYRYGDPVSGAQMRAGTAWIMVRNLRLGESTPKELGFGTQSLTIFIDAIEDHFERAKSAGVTLLEDLHETVYGEFQYAAQDLDGHHWIFSRHARDLSPADWGATILHAPLAPPQIAPMLSVRNGSQAIDFYRTAFGAQILFRGGSEDSVIAELSACGSRFWIADESPEHQNFSPQSLGGSTTRMIVIVDDPDAAFERAVQAGAMPVWPVADQRYGWRVGRLADPFGHHWEIGKPLKRNA